MNWMAKTLMYYVHRVTFKTLYGPVRPIKGLKWLEYAIWSYTISPKPEVLYPNPIL